MTDAKPILTADRFEERVDRSAGPEGCWPWTGAKSPCGHGQVSIKLHGHRRGAGAHQVAHFRATACWEERDYGRCVRHLCHNRLCCNPAHLRGGTVQQNSDDRKARRMGWPLRNAAGDLVWPFDLPVHLRPTQYPEPAA